MNVIMTYGAFGLGLAPDPVRDQLLLQHGRGSEGRRQPWKANSSNGPLIAAPAL